MKNVKILSENCVREKTVVELSLAGLILDKLKNLEIGTASITAERGCNRKRIKANP